MSYISNLVHFIWSTKDREPLIHPAWQPRMFDYIGGILRNKRAVLRCAGGMPDHIHLYVSLPSTLSLASCVNIVKSNSSKWIREEFHGMREFHWQKEYAAFSVSKSGEADVMKYILSQEDHHRVRTFKEEVVAFLDRHGVTYDVRYIWR